MGPRRRLIAGMLLVAACAAGWLAVPRRFVIDGVSMGPALLPGDVVRTGMFPALDRLRRPRRFERWVLAATDALAVKRVVGLPGEEVSIAGGDLAIDGAVVLKGPRLLAELGSVVADEAATGEPHAEPGWLWSHPGGEILDDAAFDTGAGRTLEPVRDAGFAAVVDVSAANAADPARVRVRVGDSIVEWTFDTAGRQALAAGRLDGRLVLAAWRPTRAIAEDSRSCLPADPPDSWLLAQPWPADGEPWAEFGPSLAIGCDDGRVVVASAARWRDVAYRTAADGRETWSLGAGELFVLGDHPPASNDSRRWGPVRTTALLQRVAGRGR